MFGKILVAVDLETASATTVLQRAIALKTAGGQLWVVHVVEPQLVQYSIDPTISGRLSKSLADDAIRGARSRLSDICRPLGISEDHQLVVIGHPADEIHKLASEHAVNVIMLGSHGRRGIQRLLGSTANAVLHDSPVNVMTLRIDGRKKGEKS